MIRAKIIYASLTGNTEEIASYVYSFLKEKGAAATIQKCEDFRIQSLDNSDICIIATYTYGDGDLPQEMISIYEELSNADLSGKVFGVCGSGDTFYEEFCKSVDDFEEILLNSGAESGASNVKVDTNVEEEDIIKLKEFANDIFEIAFNKCKVKNVSY